MAAKTRKPKNDDNRIQRVKSRIAAVTVYADRAMITRVAHASLDVGELSLIVDGLPANLDEYSLRVGGKGPARVKVLGVKISREWEARPSVAEAQRLAGELEKAEDEIRALSDQRQIQEERAEKVRALAESAVSDLAKTLARKRVEVAEADAVLTYLFESLQKTQTAIAKSERLLRQKQREREAIKAAYEKIQVPRPDEQKAATVTLECSAGGEFDLVLSYVMPDAGWASTYDVRYDEAVRKTEITYRAAVFQRTGEDWDKVNLRLSTSRPAAGAAPPPLVPRSLDFLSLPSAPRRSMSEAYDLVETAAPAPVCAAAPAEAEEEPAPAEMAAAAVESGVALTYVVAGLPSVPADGEPHIVTIGSHHLDGELDYYVTPQTAAVAYIRIRGVNDAPLTFLPGVANVFRGDEYIGRASLPLTVPGGRFEYFLGADDRLKIKYECRVVADDAAGFSGALSKITNHVTAEVENNVGAAVAVVLRHDLPLPRNKDIKVKIVDVKPKPQEKPDEGIMTWEWELKPDEKKTLSLTYEIEYPRGRTVVGL